MLTTAKDGRDPHWIRIVAIICTMLAHTLLLLVLRPAADQEIDGPASDQEHQHERALQLRLIANTDRASSSTTSARRLTKSVLGRRLNATSAPPQIRTLKESQGSSDAAKNAVNSLQMRRMNWETAPAPNMHKPDIFDRPRNNNAVINRYKPVRTVFDRDWGKSDNPSVVAKVIRLPFGIKLHCSIGLLTIGCLGSPPPPPSRKDGDQRLSMSPARPIAPGFNEPVAMDKVHCLQILEQGSALPYGCPTSYPAHPNIYAGK